MVGGFFVERLPLDIHDTLQHMPNVKQFMVLLLLVFPFVAEAQSCPCGVLTPAEKEVQAQVIFVGTIRSFTINDLHEATARINFTVEEPLKGISVSTIEVSIPTSTRSCGFTSMSRGSSYLIYAKAQSDGSLKTSLCEGSIEKEFASADLNFLRSLFKPITTYQARFPDVPLDHPYYQAIESFKNDRVIQGYPDGTFRPEMPLKRVEALKIIVDSTFPYRTEKDVDEHYAFTSTLLPFSDIDERAWYNLPLRRAYYSKIIEGYRDGTLRPEQTVTVAEAVKMTVESLQIPLEPETGVWYERFIVAAGGKNALPQSIKSLHSPMTRGELVEIIWRLLQNVQDRDHVGANDLLEKSCDASYGSELPSIDVYRVRMAWLQWYNKYRKNLGLSPYTLDEHLNAVATKWSLYSADKGVLSHQREGSSEYYDYARIEDWFSAQGLTFTNTQGITFTENIGRGPYSCTKSDCTDELIEAIQSTFNFYLSEKNDSYRPHFNSIINPLFQKMGVGIALRHHEYYLTMHLATSFSSSPPDACALSR